MRFIAVLAIAGASSLIASHIHAQALPGEIRGVVRDLDRVPVPNVDIQVRKLDRVAPIRLRSAADGSFRVLNLTPGTYRIIASASGFKTTTQESIRVLPESSPAVVIQLDRPAACRLTDVSGMGHISGTITDWTGDRVPAYITLEREGASAPERALSAGIDGRYEIDLVPPGPYTLRAWVPAAPPVVSTIDVGLDQRLSIDARLVLPVRDDSTAVRSAIPTGVASLASGFGGITGQVADLSGGHIPGASATVESTAGRTWRAISDHGGVFVLPNLPPGRYSLRVSLSGFKTHSATVIVSSGHWSSGSATLAIGDLETDPHIERWRLRRSESTVRIKTHLGDITLAMSTNGFLACVERGAYTSGTLELVPSSASTGSMLRLLHGPDKPAASDAPGYALRVAERVELVVIDPVTGQAGDVEGRVVEGLDVIDRIRERLTQTVDSPSVLQIISISRLVHL